MSFQSVNKRTAEGKSVQCKTFVNLRYLNTYIVPLIIRRTENIVSRYLKMAECNR